MYHTKILITLSRNPHQQDVNINYLRAQGSAGGGVSVGLTVFHSVTPAHHLSENLSTMHCHPGLSHCPGQRDVYQGVLWGPVPQRGKEAAP